MANAFECRSARMSLRTLGLATNRLLVGAVAVEGLALLGFVYLGPVRALLGHQPLTLAQWLPVLAAPVLLFAAEETRKTVMRRRRGRRAPEPGGPTPGTPPPRRVPLHAPPRGGRPVRGGDQDQPRHQREPG
jgi:hypothetical protein